MLAWARELAEGGRTAIGYPVEYGGEGAVGRSIAAFETLAFGDLSLLVKCGVQFGLFGGAVLHLGTRRHHERYLAAIARMELRRLLRDDRDRPRLERAGLGTTATYDADAGEFVVHTPDAAARKDYIGNAARDGGMAAVFAQLVVGGEPRGVHALLVPLRDERGDVLPGVTIERLRRQARPRRRRQRPDRVRPRARPAHGAARPLRPGRARRRRTRARSRTRRSASSRCSARSSRAA